MWHWKNLRGRRAPFSVNLMPSVRTYAKYTTIAKKIPKQLAYFEQVPENIQGKAKWPLT